MGWKGKRVIYGKAKPCIFPYLLQPISSSLLPYKRYICVIAFVAMIL